jgi:hypothetical protein
MNITIHVARRKDETAAELKGILPQLMLFVPARARPVASAFVVATPHVEQVRAPQAGGLVSLALLVDQQGKRDAGLFPKQARVVCVAQSDGRQVGAALVEFLFVFAQLRDVLAAEDSTIVAQEHHHRRLPLPKRAEAHLRAARVWQHDRRK